MIITSCARGCARCSPAIRIVVLSMHTNEAYVVEALRNGASAYVLKSASSGEVVKAVREVIAGRRYLSLPLSTRAIESYAEKTRGGARCSTYYGNPEIAARLSIDVRTAETHRANLMRKLGLHRQAKVVRYALQRGIGS